MRCYHFGNMYMSSIQQGIQAAHAQMELFVKYNPMGQGNAEQIDQLYDWATNHKTMICLNGGMDFNLIEIADYVSNEDNPYPWTTFHESEEAMGGMLTNVAIVLPEHIYEASKVLRKNPVDYTIADELSSYEIGLAHILSQCGLAS